MISFGNTQQHAIPGVVNLLVGKVFIAGNFSQAVAKFSSGDLAAIKSIKNSILLQVTEKLIGPTDTQLTKGICASLKSILKMTLP
jgi:hypothetical protein